MSVTAVGERRDYRGNLQAFAAGGERGSGQDGRQHQSAGETAAALKELPTTDLWLSAHDESVGLKAETKIGGNPKFQTPNPKKMPNPRR